MYSRNSNTDSRSTHRSVPPDYRGNAFDSAGNRKEPHIDVKPNDTRDDEMKVHSSPPHEEEDTCKPVACEREESKGILGSLFRSGSGKEFAIDDILLIGLIILLFNSHADDELLLILALLFIVDL